MAGAEPKVSVVIPAYNRAGTIRRAVDSALAQSMGDFELILVDDCSTDDTVAVVNAIGDARIRVLSHDSNRRAAAARNTGIRAARGRYVAFLDSDDAWHPDKLATQLKALEAGPEDVRASCTGYRVIDRDVAFVRVPALLTHRDMYMGCDLSPGSTLMVRRDVFDEVGLNDEEYTRYEDWDWALRYTERYRMGLVAEPLADVFRGGYPSAGSVVAATEHLVAAHREGIDRLAPAYRRKVLALRWFEVAQHCFRDRDLSTGTYYLLKGLKTQPLVRIGMYVILVDTLFGTGLQRALWRAKGALQGKGH